MTVEEKLEKFYQVSMEHAQEECASVISEYEEGLEKIFLEHKENAERQSALTMKTEEEESRRLSNMEVSKEQIELKHKISRKEIELTESLFEEVEQKLEAYHKSPAYAEWLKAQIREELAFDTEAEIVIYIDPSDEAMLPELEKLVERENAQIRISQEKFMGGSRGVIHSRNILIDNSLAGKLADVRDSYQLREEL